MVATGLGLIQPNFWPLRYLAALARSGYGEPNSAARGLDKSIHSSLHDAPSSDLVCDENGIDPVDTFASSFDVRWKVLVSGLEVNFPLRLHC